MAWVKLHDDILGDPKLMRAARMGGTELVLLPWLLAFASKAADHGRISVGAVAAEPEDLAYQIPGVTAAQVEAAQRTLVAIGILALDEDGCLRFTKWEDRQAKPSDSKTAIRERVKRHRDKQKEGNAPPALPSVTAKEKSPKKKRVTPCNATEKRRGEEKREEEEGTAPPVGNDGGNGSDAPPKDKLDALPKVLCDAGYEAWRRLIGGVDYGRYRKALLTVYEYATSPVPNEAELIGATAAFAEQRDADKVQFRATYTPERFAGDIRSLVRLGAMQHVDEWGDATERGRVIGLGAA